MSNSGKIYILLNPSFTTCLKIGKTQRTSEERAKEIYRQAKTGIPTEFVVAYENEVSDCDLVEKLIHKKLESKRRNQDREFFDIPLKEAIRIIDSTIKELESQQTIYLIHSNDTYNSPRGWWNNLSFVWQQIFRMHLNISYDPTEIDLIRATHSVIDHCQHEKLRKKVIDLISNKNFTKNLKKWYTDLSMEKDLFNSYSPYTPSDAEIQKLFSLEFINCSNNTAVIDLTPLCKIVNLRRLNCTNTSVNDLNSLRNLLHLEEIQINYTNISLLDPLDRLPSIKKIACYGTEVHADNIKKFSKSNPNCQIIEDIFLTSNYTSRTKKKI